MGVETFVCPIRIMPRFPYTVVRLSRQPEAIMPSPQFRTHRRWPFRAVRWRLGLGRALGGPATISGSRWWALTISTVAALWRPQELAQGRLGLQRSPLRGNTNYGT